MKICVCCSGNLGLGILRSIFHERNVGAVLTDKKSVDITAFCDANNIPFFAGNPRKGKGYEFLKRFRIDVLVSVNYLYIIESDIISYPSKLAFNIHGSLLPKYRGRTPHVWAIINNEHEAGVTAHLIDEGCDTGDIILQVKVAIDNDDTGNDLLLKYHKEYGNIVFKVLSDIEKGNITAYKQNDQHSTYFGKRTPEDGRINWNWQRERIRNWVRAQSNPYPGAFTFSDQQKITIDRIDFVDVGYAFDMPNGLIVSDSPLLVKTPNGVVKLSEYREDIKLEPGNILA